MINKQEIMEEAKKHNLPPNTIEKDYVLSWLNQTGTVRPKYLRALLLTIASKIRSTSFFSFDLIKNPPI